MSRADALTSAQIKIALY